MAARRAVLDDPERQLRSACAELGRRLRAGESCTAEDYLRAAPGLAGHSDAALELIYTEYVVREEMGQQPSRSEWFTATPTGDTSLSYALLESPKPACGETVPADDRRFLKDLASGGYTLREDREAMTCFHVEEHPAVVAEYVFLAELAGEFRLPPARAEMMYRPATGGHSDSFTLRVK